MRLGVNHGTFLVSDQASATACEQIANPYHPPPGKRESMNGMPMRSSAPQVIWTHLETDPPDGVAEPQTDGVEKTDDEFSMARRLRGGTVYKKHIVAPL